MPLEGLVGQLRALGEAGYAYAGEAADEIERLRCEVKTIKEHLRDATELAMDKREMEKHCGNALAEITRLELVLQTALEELISFRDNYTGEFADNRLRRLMTHSAVMSGRAPKQESGET